MQLNAGNEGAPSLLWAGMKFLWLLWSWYEGHCSSLSVEVKTLG